MRFEHTSVNTLAFNSILTPFLAFQSPEENELV